MLDANGNWMKNNPIPSGYPSWNSFMELRLKSQEDCKAILEELQGKLENGNEGEISEEEKKVAAFYGAGMDEDAIETVGIEPLTPVLNLCKKISSAADKQDRAFLLGNLARRYSIRPFFAIGSGPDKKNSAWSTAQVYQGGIALPDRDYYFDEDKANQRDEYKKFMGSLLAMLQDAGGGNFTQDLNELVDAIYKLEESLAEAHMTKTENRDPETTYNKMSIKDLNELCDGKFDFGSYFKGATGKSEEELGDVNVRNVKAIQCAAFLIDEVNTNTFEGYLRWKTVCSYAPYLGKEFVQRHFDFYEGVLQGTKEMKARWKRVMEFTESALGKLFEW
jgi:putative endopeptidase